VYNGADRDGQNGNPRYGVAQMMASFELSITLTGLSLLIVLPAAFGIPRRLFAPRGEMLDGQGSR
jgi:hypothetical protein